MISKLEAAHQMARSHFRAEPDLKHVFLLEPLNEEDPQDPIKLLEVVEGTLETGFEPVGLPANPGRGVSYPSLIIEISPRQLAELKNGEVPVNEQVWRVARELHAA